MTDKLQELTDKLYNEGLAKGKAEGEKFLGDAKMQAEQIVADAKAEAQAIIAKAKADAADLKSKAESDVKMASAQALTATRKDIETLMSGAICDAKIKSTLQDAAFVKEIIKEVAVRFSTQESCDIALTLPESLRSELEPWVNSELAKALSTKVSANFSKKVSGGFTIAPSDGSYYVSLTDETFNALITEYLRPVTRKLLFGE